jgi:hypothetical protein
VAVNDQYRGEFMPGISAGAEGAFRAPGSSGASGGQADSTGTDVTPPWGGHQDRYPAAAGTVEPGQNEPTPVSPGPASGYTSTGAGAGSGSHYPRRPGQQPDGGA